MDEQLRILMLEDNPTDADLIQYGMQEEGLAFSAKVVMTETEFLRELEAFAPDLVLSDYDLPQYNGILALAAAKKSRPDLPFILVTGAIGEDRAIEILTQGANDYVMKSRLTRLVPAIRRTLAETGEQRARKAAEEKLRDMYKILEIKVAQRTAAQIGRAHV